jgi:hypothetical protein
MIGFEVPFWREALDLVRKASLLFTGLPIMQVGWDIGFTESGPVIIEANPRPNLVLTHEFLRGTLAAYRSALGTDDVLHRQSVEVSEHRHDHNSRDTG